MKSFLTLLNEEHDLVQDYNRVISAAQFYEREAEKIKANDIQSCSRDCDISCYMREAEKFYEKAKNLLPVISKKRKEITNVLEYAYGASEAVAWYNDFYATI